MKINPNILLKQDDKIEATKLTSKIFNRSKQKINGICKSLSRTTTTYEPSKTVDSIQSYLDTPDKLDRILYSEISQYIFSLDSAERGIFTTNVEKLLHYSFDKNHSITPDCRKIIVKIFDHSQLALYQIENANNIFAKSIDEAKENLKKEVKGIEKEYISILGIFASIVFAFVGGLTFSSSVLQNISSVSIFRLLIIIDFLAFVFLNIVYLLLKFISTINDKDRTIFSIKWINITCFVVAVVIIIAWLVNIQSLPQYISRYIPWMQVFIGCIY